MKKMSLEIPKKKFQIIHPNIFLSPEIFTVKLKKMWQFRDRNYAMISLRKSFSEQVFKIPHMFPSTKLFKKIV